MAQVADSPSLFDLTLLQRHVLIGTFLKVQQEIFIFVVLAIAFAIFLEKRALTPAWIKDLVCYEKAWLKATEPSCRWLMYRFHYDLKLLIQHLQRGEDLVIREKRAIAFWFRLPSGIIRQITL